MDEMKKTDVMDRLSAVLVPLTMFLALTSVSRIVVLLVALLALVCSLGKGSAERLRGRASLVAVGVLVYGLVVLASGLGSAFGNYAVDESTKILTALAVFLLALYRAPGTRQLLVWLTGCAAVIGFLCIEGSSTNVLTPMFNAARQLLGYNVGNTGYEVGVRITGIYGNANVSGGLLAVTLLVALYLVHTLESRKGLRAILAYVALGMEALAFLLSFSMGAMATFFVTCLIYVALSRPERRMGLFILMVETALVTVLCAFGATLGLGAEGGIAALPVALSVVCGLVVWAVDSSVGAALSRKLADKSRLAFVAMGGFVALLAVYVALAMNLTGALELVGGERISRAAYLAPGSYTVTLEGVDANVRIYTQNDKDLMMHTDTTLYEGKLAGAEFDVPEDSSVVWFRMEGSGTLERVALSDGTELNLGYKLLPAFAANRLQGLRANQNFIQRIVFWQDGLKLWNKYPLTGAGLGGVEGRVTEVQDFYYESKYVHNHFIQLLAESSLWGLGAFAFLLLSAFWTLRKKRGGESDPVIALLSACVVMMVAHSLVEVVWSHQEYQAAALLIFAAIAMLPGEPVGRGRARAYGAALCLVVLVFTALNAGNLAARLQMVSFKTESAQEFIAKAHQLDTIDVYDDEDLKLAIIKTAMEYGREEDFLLAGECAMALRDRREFASCRSVAAYYDLPWLQLEDFFRDMRLGVMQEASNPWAWNEVFYTFRWAGRQLPEKYVAEFVSGVVDTADYLEQFNQGRMEPIVLDQVESQFVEFVRVLEGRDDDVIFENLQKYLTEVAPIK